MTFVVGPTGTQSVEKKNAFWTALERVVKEVPEHEQFFCINGHQRTHGTEGRREAVE